MPYMMFFLLMHCLQTAHGVCLLHCRKISVIMRAFYGHTKY